MVKSVTLYDVLVPRVILLFFLASFFEKEDFERMKGHVCSTYIFFSSLGLA